MIFQLSGNFFETRYGRRLLRLRLRALYPTGPPIHEFIAFVYHAFRLSPAISKLRFSGLVAIMEKAHMLLMVQFIPPGAILIVLALLHPPAGEAIEPIEVKWKQSIETDLRNGDPAGDVCAKAKRRAAISDDVAFKNWAYNIARRTCPQLEHQSPSPFPPPARQQTAPYSPLTTPGKPRGVNMSG